MTRAGLLALALLLLGLAGYCLTPRAGAQEAPPVPFVWDLQEPALLVPAGFAEHGAGVIACESSWRTSAVNVHSGASGLAQLHPVHRRGMEQRGLDYTSERDRLYYAAWYLWPASGWALWGACAP